MSQLFSPLTLRGLTLRNRTVVAPMCQYSARHGLANDWHLVHLGRFAIGGFGLVIVEATGVTAEGRISYADLGLWEDAQMAPLARIVDFLHDNGAAAGIQLAHAGRKASTPVGFGGALTPDERAKATADAEFWLPVAPSPVIHADKPEFQTPAELDEAGIAGIVEAFAAAARRADEAGFDVVEIHGAHGYLLNEFLSPISNKRTDRFGGSRENRMRMPLMVAEAVRAAWPQHKPLFMRLSTTDSSPDGWSVADSVVLAHELTARGVDMIHCSSGGFDGFALKSAPLYQVPLSAAVRASGVPTIAVGLIGEPQDAEGVLARGEADLVALARGALDDPNWALHAHHALDGGGDAYGLWPMQARARMRDRDRVLGRYA